MCTKDKQNIFHGSNESVACHERRHTPPLSTNQPESYRLPVTDFNTTLGDRHAIGMIPHSSAHPNRIIFRYLLARMTLYYCTTLPLDLGNRQQQFIGGVTVHDVREWYSPLAEAPPAAPGRNGRRRRRRSATCYKRRRRPLCPHDRACL